MTIIEMYKYFGSAYAFNKATGMSATSLSNWKRIGYIPIRSQAKIEQLTNGGLKARFEDDHRWKKR